MRRTIEEAEITRNKILDAALNVFSREGYANTRLEDIASEAGVTRGAVYHHFGGKPDVYLALTNERFAEANKYFLSLSSDQDTPKELLRKLAEGLLTYLEENDNYRKIQELVLFKTARIPELEKGLAQKTESTNAFIGYIESIIIKGIESGEFRKDVEANTAAIAILGYLNGLASLWLLDTNLFSIKKKAEGLVDIMLKGLV